MPDRNLLALRWREADKIARETILTALRPICAFQAGAVLDVGAGERGYAGLFDGLCARYVTLDIDPAMRPDVVGSALAIPFNEACFDTVISTQTLEHLTHPEAALREVHRVLRRGGRLVLSAPQTWPMHLIPHDFFRFTRFGLDQLLKEAGFEIERIEACGGFFATVGQQLASGVFHAGTHARHSRVRRLWRRGLLPLINWVFLSLDRKIRPDDGTVLNWVVLARR